MHSPNNIFVRCGFHVLMRRGKYMIWAICLYIKGVMGKA
jgi:hypothetical protein